MQIQVVKVQEITITKAKAVRGSERIAYNVDVDGAPFGAIWKIKDTPACFNNLWNVSMADGSEGYPGFATRDEAQAQIVYLAGLKK